MSFNTPIVIENNGSYIRAGLSSDDSPSVVFRTDSITNSNPIKAGVICDWNGMKQVWSAIFEQLEVDSSQHPVLITEAPLNPETQSEETIRTFFETFNVQGAYIVSPAILALYTCGLSNGIVVFVENSTSYTVPIYEGISVPHAIYRISLGLEHMEEDNIEVFFNPSLRGIKTDSLSYTTFLSIEEAGPTIRSTLYKNIVLVGDGATLPGIAERLEEEIRAIKPRYLELNVTKPSDPQNAVWQGGDKLSPLLNQHNMWISADEYAQHGATIVHRKCL